MLLLNEEVPLVLVLSADLAGVIWEKVEMKLSMLELPDELQVFALLFDEKV